MRATIALVLLCSSTLWAQIPAYDRADYPHWAYQDRDCQNTRHEMLIRDASAILDLTADGCRVLLGRWRDPYTGAWYDDAADLHIDHVVSLSDAHRSGGWLWTRDQREAFANDPRNLLAVGAGVNISKSDKGPADWAPPDPWGRCAYLETYMTVKDAYGLTLTVADARAIAGSGCAP